MLRRRPRIELLGALYGAINYSGNFDHEGFHSRFRKVLGERVANRISLALGHMSELVELLLAPCERTSEAGLERRSKGVPDLRVWIV